MAPQLRYNSHRLSIIAAALFVIFVLFYFTEPRRRSWSCKTLSSCLGGRPRTYNHWDSVDPYSDIDEYGKTFHDGTIYFHRQVIHSNPDTLVLVLNKDELSWSKDFQSTRRNIYDFLDLLVSTDLDFSKVSLSLMTSSRKDFESAKRATATYPFARVALFYREESGPDIAYGDRHKADVQHQRRASIAGFRNYLMSRTLRDEDHIVWIDADIVEFSKGIVQTMIGHATQRDEVGIITSLCSQTLTYNYDKNAWAVNREDPLLMGLVADDQQGVAVERLVETRTYVDELVKETNDTDLIPIDSVGGTLLYIRASLVRSGVNFPTANVVGTTWTREGWIGIETEGICYQASHLANGGCYVLGGNHVVRHADQA